MQTLSEVSLNIALIPARADSKRFPGKNTALLKGKPLITYTINAVLDSGIFDEVIVSSDDINVLDLALNILGVDIHDRPKYLASDTATTLDVLLFILQEYDINHGICGVFLPTSPFREVKHILESWKMLTEEVDSVISICQYECPPSFSLYLDQWEKGLQFPDNSPLLRGNTQFQLQPKAYHPNGAIYLSKISSIKINKSFFQGVVAGYLMDKFASIDIDEKIDLEIANAILNSTR